MSAKTKIVVLHMKELVYTVIFVVLAVLLILLFVFSGSKKDESAKETMKYTPGKYTSSILFNDNSIDVEVVVDENRMQLRFAGQSG